MFTADYSLFLSIVLGTALWAIGLRLSLILGGFGMAVAGTIIPLLGETITVAGAGLMAIGFFAIKK